MLRIKTDPRFTGTLGKTVISVTTTKQLQKQTNFKNNHKRTEI